MPPGTQLRVISAPDNDYDPQSWWRTAEGVRIFFHELGGYVEALWQMRHNDVRTTDLIGAALETALEVA